MHLTNLNQFIKNVNSQNALQQQENNFLFYIQTLKHSKKIIYLNIKYILSNNYVAKQHQHIKN